MTFRALPAHAAFVARHTWSAANMVNIHLLKTDGGWIHALTIPLQDIARLSLCPLKWLCFITFAAVGAKGNFSEAPGGNVINYENVLLDDLAEDYYFTPEGNTPTSKPPTTVSHAHPGHLTPFQG